MDTWDRPEWSQLWDRVLTAARALVEDQSLQADGEGDLAFRWDDVMVFVRLLREPASILVFSPVLIEVPPTPPLLDALNAFNEHVRFVRFAHSEDGVVVDIELFGDPFDPALLGLACRAVSAAAREFGPDLQADFGGRLYLGDASVPAPSRGLGGYL